MRQLVTGVDGEGRSCVLSAVENPPTGVSVRPRTVYETATAPPPPRPPGHSRWIDLHVGVGLARWIVVQWPPGLTALMHHTDTVDFDTVLEGTIDLILDDGPHRLEAGDCVVVAGVDHGWAAGPEGATVAVALLGTPPPAA
jgi:quercetin dioxygenase-like cupin family protein